MTPAGPPRAPTGAELDDRDRFAAMTTGSLAAVQAAAEKWRTGTGALVTLAVAGVFAKGPGAFNEIGGRWQRWTVVVLGFLGLGCALLGFWYALRAAAGDWALHHRDKIVKDSGSVAAFEAGQAATAASNLEKGKEMLVGALVLLLLGSFLWVVSPKASDQPVVTVTPAGGEPYCGKLESGDGQKLRVKVPGESVVRELAFDRVANVKVSAKC